MAHEPSDPTTWTERDEPIDLDDSPSSVLRAQAYVAPTPKREPPDAEERPHLRAGFAALLRSERITAGYTQDEMAKHTGLNERTVQRFEAGEMRPTKTALLLLALVIHRPEVLTGRGGRPLVRGMNADARDAFALVKRFEEALGASVAEGGERKSRTSRANHLFRHGCTPEERTEQIGEAMDRRLDATRRKINRMQAERALRSGNRAQMQAALDALRADYRADD